MKIITIARKPLSEKNVASNILKHGCGALNVDASRIATADGKPHFEDRAQGVSLKSDWIDQGGMFSEDRKGTLSSASPLGRWPANVLILGHPEVLDLFPYSVAGLGVRNNKNPTGNGSTLGHMSPTPSYGHNDSGSSARFFKQFKEDE